MMMDEEISLFRAYLVKEARIRARRMLESAASGEAHLTLVQGAGQAIMLENLIKQLDVMHRDPRAWAVTQGLILAEPVDVVVPEEET